MALTLSHFRFGINELAESTHGWHAAEDTDITFDVTTTFLLRLCIQADATGLNNVDYEWQYNLNGAGWVNITTSSTVVKAVTSVLSNGTACTERLSGTGSFAGGAGQTTDGTSGGTAHDIVNSGSGETEASLQVNAGTVNPGDIIQFRVTRDGGNLLNTYAVTPALTVAGDPSVPPRALAAVLALVLLAWQPIAPAQIQRVEIAPTITQEVAADAPPVRDRRLLTRIIAQWWKPILHGTSGDAAPAVVADVPPPKLDALPRILANWAPASPLPARPVRLIQGAPTAANDPPFDSRRSSFTPIYQAWKWRPVGAGNASAEVVNDPPFGGPSAFDQVFASWVAPVPRSQSAADVAALPGISVDPPPVIGTDTATLRTILGGWTPAPPMPQQTIPRAPVPSVDPSPPTTPADMLATVAAAWVPAPPVPPRAGLLSPGITGQSVDPPPVRRLDPRAQEIGWQPAPLQVVYVSRLVFEYLPDNPPFGLAKLAGPIYAAWLPVPPAPQWGRHVVPISEVAGAPPPFDQRRAAFGPIYAAWKWRPVGSGDAPPVVPDVPLPRRPEQPILSAWQTPAPAPQWGRHVPVQADAPPVIGTTRVQRAAELSWRLPPSLPQRAPLSLPASVDPPPPISAAGAIATIAAAWVPGSQSAQAGAHVPVSTLSVNDPPFGGRPPVASIISAWEPGPPAPHLPAYLVQPSAPVNDPPFGGRPPLAPILSAWVPGPPAPHLPLYLVQPSAAEAVNDPPFGQRPWLLVSLGGWQLPPPLPWRPTWLVQGGVAAVDAPPSGLDTSLSSILSAWQPPFVLPPRRAVQVPPEVAPELPPAGHPVLPSILAAWYPPSSPPFLRGLLSPGIPGQSVDAPPIGFRLPLRWPPPPPDPPQPRAQIATLPGVSVDPPPPGSRALMATLRAAWEPGPPAAQWGRHVPPSVAHVPVNDPPFGIRPWLSTVRERWEPGPPAPLLRLVVATESGPVNQVDFMYAGSFTSARAGAAAAASQVAGSGRITSQRAGGGPISGDGG